MYLDLGKSIAMSTVKMALGFDFFVYSKLSEGLDLYSLRLHLARPGLSVDRDFTRGRDGSFRLG